MSAAMRACLGVLAMAACALAGCVTAEYGPIGAKSPYGYSDRQNADGSYTVLVVSMTPSQAHEYWDRRAAEICGHSNYRKNIFRAEIPVVTTTGYASNPYNPGYGGSYTQDTYGNLIMEGYLHCDESASPSSDEAEPPAAPSQASQSQP